MALAGRQLLRLAPFLLRLPLRANTSSYRGHLRRSSISDKKASARSPPPPERSPYTQKDTFDIVGEALICMLRLHGADHPLVRALHARLVEYVVHDRSSTRFLLGEHSSDAHLLVVTTAALSMIAGEGIYGEPVAGQVWYARGLLAEQGWAGV